MQVCCGMNFLHSHNVLHKDLTLRNIIYEKIETQPTFDIVIKIADKGLTRIVTRKKTYEELYFHPDCVDRDSAEAKLSGKKEGSFLFRGTNDATTLVVSFVKKGTNGKCSHAKIKIEPNGGYQYLKKHYSQLQDIINESHSALDYPVYYQEKFDASYLISPPPKTSLWKKISTRRWTNNNNNKKRITINNNNKKFW